MDTKRSYGALPPPEFEWWMGKTAGAIRFVQDANALLEDSSLSEEASGRLRRWVAAVMEGEPLDIDHFLTREEIIARCV